MRRRTERIVGFAAGLAAAAVFALCELVMWSGQPGDGATGREVVRWYADNRTMVRGGDILWTLGAIALVVAAVVMSRGMEGSARRWIAIGASVAAVALAASGGVAFWLSLRASSIQAASAHTLWWTEGLLAGIGARVLAVPLLAALAILVRRGVGGVVLGVIGAVLAIDALVLLSGPFGLLAVAAWLGVAALVVKGSQARGTTTAGRPEAPTEAPRIAA
jgi:hypothetical protein